MIRKYKEMTEFVPYRITSILGINTLDLLTTK